MLRVVVSCDVCGKVIDFSDDTGYIIKANKAMISNGVLVSQPVEKAFSHDIVYSREFNVCSQCFHNFVGNADNANIIPKEK